MLHQFVILRFLIVLIYNQSQSQQILHQLVILRFLGVPIYAQFLSLIFSKFNFLKFSPKSKIWNWATTSFSSWLWNSLTFLEYSQIFEWSFIIFSFKSPWRFIDNEHDYPNESVCSVTDLQKAVNEIKEMKQKRHNIWRILWWCSS